MPKNRCLIAQNYSKFSNYKFLLSNILKKKSNNLRVRFLLVVYVKCIVFY